MRKNLTKLEDELGDSLGLLENFLDHDGSSLDNDDDELGLTEKFITQKTNNYEEAGNDSRSYE